MAKRIHLIYSFGGNKNFGDDYIVSEWIKHADEFGYNKRILVSSDSAWLQSCHMNHDAVFNTFLAGMAAHFAYSRKKSKYPDGHMPVAEYIDSGREAADHLWQFYPTWRPVIESIAAFHACGGGYINTIFPNSYAVLAMMARLAERIGAPLYGTGLGLLPAEPNVDALAQLFESFHLIECRDINSYEFLKNSYPSSKAVLGFDDTFLTQVFLAPQPSRPPMLFVNVQSDLTTSSHASLIEKIISAQAALGMQVAYMAFFENSDMLFYKKFRESIDCMTCYSKDQLYRGGLPFVVGDYCISSRFHCHLLAARSGVKGAYISGKSGYYDIKHNSVVNLGSGWSNFLADDFSPVTLMSSLPPAIDDVGIRRKKQMLAREIFMA